MTKFRAFPIGWFYGCIAAAFLVGNWYAGLQAGSVRWPEVAWLSTPSAIHAGIDHGKLDRSVQRLPSVRNLRMLGNNLRIALGQRLEWILWGEEQSVPVLAARIELPISTGLTQDSLRANLDLLIRRLSQYSAKLQSEGWDLYVVPIPTKLSIYREDFSWPVLDADPLNRQPVPVDRADELFAYLDAKLTGRGVHLINLQTVFRQERLAHPDQWLYPPGESHWSGHGIEVASRFGAQQIARTSGLTPSPSPDAHPLPNRHIGDITRSMDAFPGLLARYRGIYDLDEVLNRWPVYTPVAGDNSAILMAVLGTSYTGQYGWLSGEPVGFAAALGAHLHHAKVYQISQTGAGGYHPFRTFLERKPDLVREFSAQTGQSSAAIRKIVVWEFPIRDFGYLTAETEAKIIRIANPNGLEIHREKQLFWMNEAATVMDIFATDNGVVTLQAEFYPGAARRSQNDRTLLIRDETGITKSIPLVTGPQTISYPVKAGMNRLTWSVLEKPDTPPVPGGDPRTLLLSVFNLQLSYQPEPGN